MLLAIDTSTPTLSIALASRTALLAEHTWHAGQNTTTQLAAAVQQVLASNGVAPAQLQAVAVAEGPGGFTALRAGYAFAKGLCLTHHLKMVTVNSLDILAVAQPAAPATLIAILQAGRGRIAAQHYQWQPPGWKVSTAGKIYTWDELLATLQGNPTIVCGEIDEAGRRLLHRKVRIALPAHNLRRAGYLAELGWQLLAETPASTVATCVPSYWSIPNAAG